MFCLKQKDEHKKRAILLLCVFPLHILHLDKIVWIFTLQAHLKPCIYTVSNSAGLHVKM